MLAAFAASSALAASVAHASLSCSGGSCSEAFAYTKAIEQWQVPNGVTAIKFTAKGAGGGGPWFGGSQDGGSGAKVTSTLAVSSRDTLELVVGGAGSYKQTGGYGGGGKGGSRPAEGGGGGGGTFVFAQSGSSLLLAAGGGGGAGSAEADGGAGGENGVAGQTTFGASGLGGGGAQTNGPGSAGGSGGNAGTAGQGPTTSTTIEGAGGTGAASGESGGGGGGGYYGGGGGGAHIGGIFEEDSGGGGGGSSFIAPGASATSIETGSGAAGGHYKENGANGELALEFTQPTMTVSLSASSTTPSLGAPVTYAATVSPAPSSGSVSFMDGGSAIAGCEARAVNTTTGKATCEVTYNALQSHSITASYTGSTDTIYRAQSTPSATTVSPQPPSSQKQESQVQTPAGGTQNASASTTTSRLTPKLRILARGGVRLTGTGLLEVPVTCGAASCRVTAVTLFRLGGGRHTWRVSHSATLSANRATELTVRLPRPLLETLRSSAGTRRHARVLATVVVTLAAARPRQQARALLQVALPLTRVSSRRR